MAKPSRKTNQPYDLQKLQENFTRIGIQSGKAHFSATQSEMAVLGYLINNIADGFTMLAEKAIKLKTEHFYLARHRVLYAELLKIYNTDKTAGVGYDLMTIAKDLQTRGIITRRDEPPQSEDDHLNDPNSEYVKTKELSLEYLAGIADIAGAPVNIPRYAEVIVEWAIKRAAYEKWVMGGKVFTDPEKSSPQDISEGVMSSAFAIAQMIEDQHGSTCKHMGDVGHKVMTRIFEEDTALRKGVDLYTGILSGFPALDAATGGFRGGELITLAAQTGDGKTALALHLANAALEPKNTGEKDEEGNLIHIHPSVLIFSMEMKATELVRRVFSMYTGINQGRLQSTVGRTTCLGTGELNKIADVAGKMQEVPLYIEDRSDLNINDIRALSRTVWHRGKESGNPLGLVVVDYLQLAAGDPSKFGMNNFALRAQEVGSVSRGLKKLAMQLDVPVLALAQVNRASHNRTDKRLQLPDLKESGSIEQDSDMVLFINSANPSEAPHAKRADIREISLDIAKNRHGRCRSVLINWKPAVNQFKQVRQPEDEPQHGGYPPPDDDGRI